MKQSDLVQKYGHFSGFIPGLDFIRNSVIKPLLFATEKVVEQYMTQPPIQTCQPSTVQNEKYSVKSSESVSNFEGSVSD